jgi:uroporphyrinogen decarboxylase
MQPKFLDVIDGKISKTPPIWLMRQAGRYLPEYRKLRQQEPNFLKFCLNEKLVVEATMQPITRFNFDAAIIFSDILTIPHILGLEVEFVENVGPKIHFDGDIKKINKEPDFALLQPLFSALHKVRALLPKDKALIGFAGSPFTIACYILGGRKKDFQDVKKFALTNKKEFAYIIDLLSRAITELLLLQAKNGADVLMLFDSWAGVLSEDLYREFVIKPHIEIVKNLRKKTDKKIICFPKNSGFFLEEFVDKVQPDVVAVDFNFPIKNAFKTIAKNITIQGNLDPTILAFASKTEIKKQVENILQASKGRKFIFNLGHGILPETPIENVEYLLELVRG